jgi:hypothetical protein
MPRKSWRIRAILIDRCGDAPGSADESEGGDAAVALDLEPGDSVDAPANACHSSALSAPSRVSEPVYNHAGRECRR